MYQLILNKAINNNNMSISLSLFFDCNDNE